MNISLRARPRSSQLTVCVKDLYRPTCRQPQNSVKKNYFNLYRFKLLNVKQTSRSISPKTPKFRSDNYCSISEQRRPEGLFIKVMQTPLPMHITGTAEVPRPNTPTILKRFSENYVPSKCLLHEKKSSSTEAYPRKVISTSLQTKKLNIKKINFKKREGFQLKAQPKNERKSIPIPRVEYLSGWEV